MNTLLCPFDTSSMKIVTNNLISLGGFHYDIAFCPSCHFESKILNTPIEEVYQHVYDKQNFIGLRLADSQAEPDRPYIKDFLKQFGKKANASIILEVGPGSARNLLYAKSQGFKTATLDVSETNNRYYSEVCQFDQVFYSIDEIADNSVDLIFLTHVIEHIPEPLKIMKELYRILRSDGVLLISTPSTTSLFKKLLNYSWWIYDIDDHVSFFNPSNLKRLLTQTSFKVVSIKSNSTDATHALSVYGKKFRKQNSTTLKKLAYSSKHANPNHGIPLKKHLHNICRDLINVLFSPVAWLGLGYEVVCIAKK